MQPHSISRTPLSFSLTVHKVSIYTNKHVQHLKRLENCKWDHQLKERSKTKWEAEKFFLDFCTAFATTRRSHCSLFKNIIYFMQSFMIKKKKYLLSTVKSVPIWDDPMCICLNPFTAHCIVLKTPLLYLYSLKCLLSTECVLASFW